MAMSLTVGFSAPKVLNFDIEARPLGWYGGDFTHKEVTAIAWAWEHEADDYGAPVTVRLLTKRAGSGKAMLKDFAKAYAEADIVAGHYIRGFDLPTLQAAYIDYELPLLGAKLTSDTKQDLIRLSGISKSQENLGSFLGLPAPKIGMSMEDWREANRLTPYGLDLVAERVEGDVLQNISMRRELIRRGLLGPPKMWNPGTAPELKYAP